jgi:hypothetical protein
VNPLDQEADTVSEQAEPQLQSADVIDLGPRLRLGQDQPIRVLVAHQSRLTAEALMFILDSDPTLEPIGYALDVHEAIQLAILLEPDVVVASPEFAGLDQAAEADEALRVWRRATRSRARRTAGSEGSERRFSALRVAVDQCADDLLATIEAVFTGLGSQRPHADRLPTPAGLSA